MSLVLCLSFANAQQIPRELRDLPVRASPDAQMSHHAQILSSDSFYGRGYQYEGHLLAAQYIADQYLSLGLRAFADTEDDSSPYFQPFSFGLNVVDSAHLQIGEQVMQIGRDFIVSAHSSRGDTKGVEFVDIGYGLPEDFSLKLFDKVVVFREGLPERINENESLKEKYAEVAPDMVKINYARQVRAKGVVILKEKLTASLSPFAVDIPVVELKAELWPDKPKKIKEWDLQVWGGPQRIQSQNVVGYIPGTEYPDSFIVITAHYDHLGMQGEAVFNGANDNASGTGMLLALADMVEFGPPKPKYSIVFIAFGGEEAGLIGSKHFVQKNPLFPLDHIAMLVNIDLMGNGDEGITMVAGAENPDIVQLFEQCNQDSLVSRIKTRGNRPNSDHYWFVEEGVPAVFIYTEGGPPHYHDVNDRFENVPFCCNAELLNLFYGVLLKRQGY